MLFSTSTLSAVLGASVLLSASASPLVSRGPCPTVATGYLSANVSNVAKAFTLNANSKVNYIGDGKNKLAVEFHHCDDPNFPSPEFGYGGIIYEPNSELCIGMSNQDAAVGPYFTILQACDQSNPAQKFFTQDLKSYVWTGETDEEGTIRQGGCGALFYRAKDTNGTPFVTDASATKYKMIEIICSSDPHNVPTLTERALLIAKTAS